LNLTNLYKKFVDKNAEAPPKAFMDALGSNRDYNVDLIPKFIMADGNLVKMLVATGMTRYLEFKPVDGSFVAKKDQSVHKVPATLEEALKTSLVSFLQKKWLHSFLKYIAGYNQANPSTWDGKDLSVMTMKELYDKMWFDKKVRARAGVASGS
jgi:Rab GDP dissociation inhibitor